MMVDMSHSQRDSDISSFTNSSIGFEGVEKRLELAFCPPVDSMESPEAKPHGLRAMKRQEIQALLKLAECTIVTELHNNAFDSYVLSESSLFIYPYRIVLKTCGKTQLLKCISLLLSSAAKLSLEPCFCKYSHGAFIFPLEQPYPYTSFIEEVKYLDVFFGHMGSEARKMGKGNQNWYIYSASTASYTGESTLFMKPMYTMEMSMRELESSFASNFFNPDGEKDGGQMTKDSGIDLILPAAAISDYAFSPCGYSMNAMEGSALSTIHVTPEDRHSYASFEVMGYDPNSLDLQHLVNHVLSLFKPLNVVISIHASNWDREASDRSWSSCSVSPDGYGCGFSERQVMPGHSVVTFHSFQRQCENSQVPSPLCPQLPTVNSERRERASGEEDTCKEEPGLACAAERKEGKERQGKAHGPLTPWKMKGNGRLWDEPKRNLEGSDSDESDGDTDSSLTSNMVSSDDDDEGDDKFER